MENGFVNFKNRNWGFRGDKGTWAKFDGKNLTVCRAAKGVISSSYTDELREFCSQYGIDFDDVRCGEKVTVEINQ